MDLIISFSGREGGNCDQLADHIAAPKDKVIRFRDLQAHPCAACQYQCFSGVCKYRSDDVYTLYDSMGGFDRVVLIVPMYCGNPASLYFIFNERGQDYFSHNDTYGEIVKRLYIIGIYGSEDETPDYIPGLEKWFSGSPWRGRVLGIQRHHYGQKMRDRILDVAEVTEKIKKFLND